MREKAGEKKTFPPVPAGETYGICNLVVDLGEEYWEKYKKWQDKILIGFELPQHLSEYPDKDSDDDDATITRPRTLTRRFKKELYDGNGEKSEFHKFLVKWIGRELKTDAEGYTLFSPEMLIGCCGNVDIVHDTKPSGKVYADIDCVRPLRKPEQKKQAGVVGNTLFLFEKLAEGDNPIEKFPKDMLEWVQTAFMKSRQVQSYVAANPAAAEASAPPADAPTGGTVEDEDDFPF
jgi:hypothetical protein